MMQNLCRNRAPHSQTQVMTAVHIRTNINELECWVPIIKRFGLALLPTVGGTGGPPDPSTTPANNQRGEEGRDWSRTPREDSARVPRCDAKVFTADICTSGLVELHSLAPFWHSWRWEVNHPCLFSKTVLQKEHALAHTRALVPTVPAHPRECRPATHMRMCDLGSGDHWQMKLTSLTKHSLRLRAKLHFISKPHPKTLTHQLQPKILQDVISVCGLS